MKETEIKSNLFVLNTNNLSLVLHKKDDVWTIPYFGNKIKDANDAVALAQYGNVYDINSGKTRSETYPGYGSDTAKSNLQNIRGAFYAIHADGDVSTQWKVTKTTYIENKDKSIHLKITLKEKIHNFKAIQHYIAIPECDIFETYVELKNNEEGNVLLSRMDSFAFESFTLGQSFSVASVCGNWGNEAQLSEAPLVKGQTIILTARSGIHNAWENNPSFMLSCGPTTENSGRVLAGALAWSGCWQIDISHLPNNQINIYAGTKNLSGPYVLAPKKSITLPKFVFTISDSGKGVVSRRMHKWARTHLMPNGQKTRDILLNSWEGAYFDFNEQTLTDMMDGVKELGGEMFVIDDGWFGKGEFARNDDTCGLGDWCWNYEKLPKGLNYLVKEAKKRGLRIGLWFEPEMANTRSELVKQHPEWVMREVNRPLRQGRGGTQVVLDMTNPEVRDAIFKQICKIVDGAKGLDYIKWDANAEFTNTGSTYLDRDKQQNLWFDYVVGYYDLLERLTKKYPKILFQACASGGGRAEFGALTRCDEFWTSDNTDARQRIFIQWGTQLFYPTNALACHVTVVPNHQTHRSTPLKFRFDVAMSGRLGLELHPKNMTEDEVIFAKKAVEEYKNIRDVIQQGDLYRLVSPYNNNHASIMYANEDKSRSVLFVWGLNGDCCGKYPAPIKMEGLDENKRYSIREINVIGDKKHSCIDGLTLGGDILKNKGVSVSLATEYDSAVFVLEEVK